VLRLRRYERKSIKSVVFEGTGQFGSKYYVQGVVSH